MVAFQLKCFVLAACQLVSIHGNTNIFLGSRLQHMAGGKLLHEGAISDLLQELETVAGRDQRLATQQRVDRLESALRPMFQAMPKDSLGLLGFDGVRYLLHRLFVQRHGWFVNGLDPAGDAWNSSMPTDIFKQHASGDVHGLFENKLAGGGFDLHHIAVLAATFESLVHSDSTERLRGAYRVLGHSEAEGSLTETEADKVIRAYMVMYVLGLDHTKVTHEEFAEESGNILELYPTWPDTEVFVNEVRQTVLADVVGSERTTWDSTLKVLEQIGERYGRWQDKECRVLKNRLMDMEIPERGRVSLDKFYSGGLDDNSWLFLESVPYLEQLGALDKADPEHMSVIIPNYINSPTNCVASSKLYSVCCVDECDAILSTLEGRIGSSHASPTLLAQLVSGLPSDTVQAPRSLPESLVSRLEDIAVHHDGQVPLHGRLFAQWMHHAYPRECPYPHVSGTTAPLVAEEYMERTGVDMLATKEDMISVIDKSKNASKPHAEFELPWSDHEELFISRPAGSGSKRESANGLLFAGLVGIACTLVSARRAFAPRSDMKDGACCKDHFV